MNVNREPEDHDNVTIPGSKRAQAAQLEGGAPSRLLSQAPPRSTPIAETAEQDWDSSASSDTSATLGRGIHPTESARPSVLIVEDERVFALNLARKLETFGYRVAGSAVAAEEALRKAEALRPDLVLMDIKLRDGSDGIETAQLIYRRWRIPVVFLTAYCDQATLNRATDSLPFGYLLKPVDSEELHATLRTAFARRGAEKIIEEGEERLRMALRAARLMVIELAVSQLNEPDVERHFTLQDISQEQEFADSMQFWQCLTQAARGILLDGLRRAAHAAAPERFAIEFTRRDLSNGTLEILAQRFSATPKMAERLVGIMRDITAQQALEERGRQADVMLQTAAEAIFVLNAAGQLTVANPAFEAITGHCAADLLGKDPLEVLNMRAADTTVRFRDALSAGRWQGEVASQRKDGRDLYAWLSLCPVSNHADVPGHYVGVLTDISQVRRAERELDHLAHHDPLTGLPNRLLFNDRLQQALERARRDHRHFAIVYLDIDGFKLVNDTMGHVIGDTLLRKTSERIVQRLRKRDTAARLGGDEFVILMEDCGRAEDVAVPVSKLLGALTEPLDLSFRSVTLTASAGVSVYPEDGESSEALLRAADTAMYEAKARGRNCFCFHTPEMARRVRERLDIEQGLRHALSTNGMLLHYQPIHRVSDRSLSGLEALVRWNHPDKGMILPGKFVGIAEESGLINSLGQWALRRACEEALALASGNPGPLRLSVNVSARQLVRDRFDENVRAALSEYGFPSESLDLELTESTLQALEDSRLVLSRIKDLGVQITIDDFGTGYSSLAKLHSLPIDRLKIDRSFVQPLRQSDSSMAIVRAIVAMARALNIRVTAEGIETAEQFALLTELGCDEAQGFLLSGPLPMAEIQRRYLHRV